MAKKEFPESKHISARLDVLVALPSKIQGVKRARDAYAKAKTSEAKKSLRKMLFDYIDELTADAEIASKAITGEE